MRRHLLVHRPATLALLFVLAASTSCKPDATEPRSFTVNPGEVALQIGDSRQLEVVGAPGQVDWSSSNSAVARVVRETGFVTAVSRGEAQITAVYGSTYASSRVLVQAPPALDVTPPTVEFEVTRGEADPAPKTVTIQNAGDGNLTGVAAGAVQYSQGQPTGWLSAQVTGSSAPYTLTLRSVAGTLPAGTYNATVPITATGVANSPQVVTVTFRVFAPASIVLSRTSVALATIPGGTVQDSVQVTNGGGRPLTGLSTSISYATAGQSWLTATLSATTAPAAVQLRVNAVGLAQGTYTATVTVASTVANVASRTINMTLTVGPGPAIQVNLPAPFFAPSGGPAPAPQVLTVNNSGGGVLNNLTLGPTEYPAGQTIQWLTATLSGPTQGATITLTVNIAGLTSGTTYTATVPVRSTVASNSPFNLPVQLTIGPPPVLAVNPSSLTFSTYSGGSVPGAQFVAVTNATNSTVIPGLSYAIQYNQGSNWLGASWQSGTSTPTNLRIQPTTGGLARGTYTATVTVSAPGLASRTVNVTYTVSSFTVDIAPLFTSGNPGGYPRLPCSSCHLSTLGGTAAQRHAYLTGWGSAVVLCKITGGASCPSEMRMPPGYVALIQAWFAAGAPSN